MFKIFKYLKQYIGLVILIVALLVIQSICDLALPQYTSQIVDTGITKRGVEETAPDYIRESQLNIIKLFFEGEDLDFISRSYKVTEDTVENDPVYKLSLENKEDINEIEGLIQKPVAFLGMLTSAQTMGDQINYDEDGQANINPLEMQEIISHLFNPATPVEDRNSIINDFFADFGNMYDTMTEQMTSVYVQNEYETIGIDVDDIQTSYIIRTGIKMVAVAFIAMLAAVAVGLLASVIAAGASMNLRNKVFRKVLSFSNEEMDKFSTASLITRNTNDIQQIQLVLVMMLRMVFYAPILGIGGVIKVLNTTRSMSWIIFIALIAILCLVTVLFIVAMPKFKIMQTMVDKVNLIAREILNGVPVIRAFNNTKHEEKRFDKANKDLVKVQLFTNRVMTFMMPAMMLIMNGVTVMIIWFGGKRIEAGNLQVGEMMAFITYTMLIVISFVMLTFISIMLPRAAVSAKRIDEVINSEISIKEKENIQKHHGPGELVFNNVTFRYPLAKDDVLKNISFKVEPGKTTAIIGSTGSGKSTLINLIPRFFDVSQGSVTIDGIDVRDMSKKDLRDLLGYVPQKATLFSGTEEVKIAAEIAQATDFIEEKEKQYGSEISQGGTNVSGGQKQRLSIARAIAKKPKIYIFDDSFSALDYKTDIRLRSALKKAMKDATVIIVAQRISTILNADQIIVLDEGVIVGKGTHKELMKTSDVYKQIAVSQLSEKEIENSLKEEEEGISHE